MNRRKFVSNLVGSVSVLVSAYVLPFQRVWRLPQRGERITDAAWSATPLEKAFCDLVWNHYPAFFFDAKAFLAGPPDWGKH